MKHCLKTAVVALLLPLGFVHAQLPKEAAIEQRIQTLLSRMTLDEKIGQMQQIDGRIPTEKVAQMIRSGKIGSIIFSDQYKDQVNRLQELAVRESRLGIPLLFARDVIHGYKTILPIPLGQAASFNPRLVEQGARVAALEASSDGIRWTFAPMIDLSRDSRWGRIAESCGEDPLLGEEMGAAMIRGFQGSTLACPTSMAACAKHFFGYGASESGKDYNGTLIPPRELRNMYLPAFERAVKEGCATFMTSFNANDGIPASANKEILRGVLRKEWGFDGVMVSDWEALSQMINHRYCKDLREVAERSLKAAVDMEMVSTAYAKHLKELVESKRIPMAMIDEAVANILRLKFRLALFENPYVKGASLYYTDDNLQTAQKLAEESVVLLKNERELLPLDSKRIKRIAMIGPLADAPYDQMGTWVFDGDKNYTITPLNALRREYGQSLEILYAPGMSYSRDTVSKGFAQALEVARKADVVLFFGGEESILTGEAHSLADISLKGRQRELIGKLSELDKPLVLILMAGRALTIEQEVRQADAVLFSFHPGTMGGPALTNLIFGKSVPSGRLPITFPRMVGQLPMYYNHLTTGRPATRRETLIDAIPVEAPQTSTGCNSFYLDAGFDPLFPFGYGLSYTRFEYKDLRLQAVPTLGSDSIRFSFELANTGKYRADETVLVYVSDLYGTVARPIKELKAFERINLASGERRRIRMSIPLSRLAYWNGEMKYGVEAGEFTLVIGSESKTFEIK